MSNTLKRNYFDYLFSKFFQYFFLPLATFLFIYLFFFQLGWGKPLLVFFYNGIEKSITDFEFSFFSVLKTCWLIFSQIFVLIFLFGISFGMFTFFYGILVYFICSIFSWVLRFFNLPNLDKIIDNLNEKKEAKCKFDNGEKFNLEMIEEKWVPSEFKFQLSHYYLEEIEVRLKTELAFQKKKLASNNKALNYFLKFSHPMSIGKCPYDDYCCEHKIANELYCIDCENKINSSINSFNKFISDYKKIKSRSSFDSKTKENIFTDNLINPELKNDLQFFELSPNFTIDELKRKRNLLIKINHPDKVSGMSEEIKKLANKQTKKINSTYNRLFKFINNRT